MPLLPRLLYAAVLLGIAGFCSFGFLATFEPLEGNIMPLRIGYGLTVVAALSAAGWTLWPRPRRS